MDGWFRAEKARINVQEARKRAFMGRRAVNMDTYELKDE